MEMRAISDSDLRIRFLFTFAGSKLFHWHNADFNIAWHSDWKKCCCEITVPKRSLHAEIFGISICCRRISSQIALYFVCDLVHSTSYLSRTYRSTHGTARYSTHDYLLAPKVRLVLTRSALGLHLKYMSLSGQVLCQVKISALCGCSPMLLVGSPLHQTLCHSLYIALSQHYSRSLLFVGYLFSLQ